MRFHPPHALDRQQSLPSGRDELERWDREIVWHAFTQMAEYEPLLIERGQGCRLFDIDGNEYIDGVSSLWCNVHGHRHPRIDAAVVEQLGRIAHTTSLGASNSTTVRLARRLVELTPEGLNHVFFSDNGATAVEVALKMAFQYWRQRPDPRPQKTTFLALGGAYHGDTLGSVSVGGVERFHSLFAPLLFEVVRTAAPQTYRLPQGVSRAGALGFYVAELEAALRANHQRLAAMVIEPLVQGAAGMVLHPPGYLRAARELSRRYDVLLIADEVAVGFGRTGRMFACEQEGVAPDLLCLAKGLTGGYLPMAATLASDEIWRAFLGSYDDSKQFFHGHTYGGNPLAAAAALASLEVFDEERVLARMPEKVSRLSRHLARLKRLDHVGDVRQCGLIAGIELVRDRARQAPFDVRERRGWRVCQHARRRGVLLRPLGDVVVIMPPLAIALEELDRIAEAVESGIVAETSA
ncbi:MAG TPA: adenosylmethionine--8-amino-7-oxononanoate transaminase [Pirellulales bacterium]|nr:adenosylmethionine--8-amino-7-oxononanoate transaminase [Pirellulales bacterium]